MTDWRSFGLCALAALPAAAFGGGAAAVSFAAAAAAVLFPQAAMRFFAVRCPPQSAFSLWAGKFSITILLLAAAARMMSGGGLWAAEYFVAGAALAATMNAVAPAMRTA